MRSVKDIMRTYIHVNRDGGPKHPVRFGSLFALAAVGLIALVLAAGSGPAHLQRGPAGSDAGIAAQDDAGSGAAGGAGDSADDLPASALPDAWDGQAAHALEPVQRELDDGMYFGYAPELYDPAHGDAYDASEAAHRAIAYHMDNPGTAAPQAVTRDGVVLGYEVKRLA